MVSHSLALKHLVIIWYVLQCDYRFLERMCVTYELITGHHMCRSHSFEYLCVSPLGIDTKDGLLLIANGNGIKPATPSHLPWCTGFHLLNTRLAQPWQGIWSLDHLSCDLIKVNGYILLSVSPVFSCVNHIKQFTEIEILDYWLNETPSSNSYMLTPWKVCYISVTEGLNL